jgi:hypothetical membrane protein
MPLVLVTSSVLPTLLAPWFEWTENALSDLGRLPEGESLSVALFVSRPEFAIFNGGLVLAGLIGLPFGWWLFDEADTHFERAGACVFSVSMALLASIGVFYIPHELHGVSAISHFLTAVVSLLLYGTGMALGGRLRAGLVTAGCGIAYLLTWVVWGVVLAPTYPTSIAIPEFVSGLFFGGWVLVVASSRLWDISWPGAHLLERA